MKLKQNTKMNSTTSSSQNFSKLLKKFTQDATIAYPMEYPTHSFSKSFVSLLPSARRATALSSPRRLDTNDLEME
ncbi:MAG: hypothetical protein HYR92_03910 [Burkholderiales bacterium]|nr:hypothetical protein [Burkholderiales bacterium]